MQRIISFVDLIDSDLIINALYRGGSVGNAGDDPISKLLGCGNQGGFRYRGTTNPMNLLYVVLYSNLSDPYWPDLLDIQTGRFTYYGDNKIPGRELHQTRRKGNLILREYFNHVDNGDRALVPPFFIFTKSTNGRDVGFRGLAVPSSNLTNSSENLVAIWKTFGGERFQNYKAQFKILDIDVIKRGWIDDIQRGNSLSQQAPQVWRQWVEHG